LQAVPPCATIVSSTNRESEELDMWGVVEDVAIAGVLVCLVLSAGVSGVGEPLLWCVGVGAWFAAVAYIAHEKRNPPRF